ncbi:hypothetical protein [Mycobacterium sp. ACS4331]|uniref:hypothetical protein n=1 Tax=Mycobacterium sp. ACS4331 TaxID=1834121 RepID=UPI001E46F64C|nr:hypothetical protein [Mycobacterium sp. ACS4331]
MDSADTTPVIPVWLRFVLQSDRAGSSWYIGAGFFFAPLLVVLSPWPVLTTAAWVCIGLAGLWLGLLGIAMATGLAIVLKSGGEIPEDYWRSILDYPTEGGAGEGRDPGRLPARGPAVGGLVTCGRAR